MWLPVIVLNNLTNAPYGRQVLIVALRADVVQRLWGLGITIGPCEVYSHLHRKEETNRFLICKKVFIT